MTKYNIAIVGATGLVGRTMLKVLEERNFPINSIKLLASERSAGNQISFGKDTLTVEALTENSFEGVDIALFSAGGAISKKFAPIAANSGCIAIDNSSAFRMHPDAPLVVPEVNSEALANHHGIIANPNCSTIQMVVALHPIKEKFGLIRVLCSTYQSISGAGQSGVSKLFDEVNDTTLNSDSIRIAYNLMFHPFEDNNYTGEENKMINETRKIMSMQDLPISVTCVRLPILGGHGEAVTIKTEKATSTDEIRQVLASSEGIIVVDNPLKEQYPYPNMVADKDEVFIGRIRKDESDENSFHLFVVADNLRKGAATNAVQIAEALIKNNNLNFKAKI